VATFGSEEERRSEAIRLVKTEGTKVADAAETVGRSRRWLSKWLARDRAGGDVTDRSKASSTSFQPLDPDVTVLVLAYRDQLEKSPVASVGGLSILAAMERDGISTRLPSVRSIERILTVHGRSTPPVKKTSRSTVPVLPLPTVGAVPGVWQQSDWIQDRYLSGGIRFNSIQITDVGSEAMWAGQHQRRSLVNAVSTLLDDAWPILSIPLGISVDNAFAKTSHENNPWTAWTRVCLFFGVELIVSPPAELGWTNHVENINNLWQNRTIARHHYQNLTDLIAHNELFCQWANHERPVLNPTEAGTRYPAELIDAHRHQLRWPPDIRIIDHLDTRGRLHIPLTNGRVTFLRRVADKAITIAQHNWPVDLPDDTLVVASITTGDATLTIRHQATDIITHSYPIRHPITTPYYPASTHSLYHHA
jgi:hypothetical protein